MQFILSGKTKQGHNNIIRFSLYPAALIARLSARYIWIPIGYWH